MAFWVSIGIIVGAILGGLGGGVVAAITMAALGAGVGFLIGRSTQSKPQDAPPPPAAYGEHAADTAAVQLTSSSERSVDASAGDTQAGDATSLAREVLRRLDRIEARLAGLEARMSSERAQPVSVPTIEPAATAAPDAGAASLEGPPERYRPPAVPSTLERTEARSAAATAQTSERVTSTPFVRAPDGTLEPAEPPRPAAVGPAGAPPDAPPTSDSTIPVGEIASEAMRSAEPPARPHYGGGDSSSGAASLAAPLWRWLSGGNALTRIGIVILFFGVAFLLRYVAEIVTVPIEARLLGVAVGGLALAGLGVVLARQRPAYGLSLEGAGMGIVYLTIFAAFRLYEVLAPAPAIGLLVIIAAATVVLALRHDSQPLAALALAGGFLAPLLIRVAPGSPTPLFSYFAVLNAVIFVLAWRRAWRPLNVLGFVFTFALGLFWGHQFYIPAYFWTVEPFLAAFFLFYVAIAILYARGSPLSARAPVDAVLVFGVPLVGFALQIAIVRGFRYGVAWSAGTIAVFYAVLWLVLRNRSEAGLALLAKTFAALALVFATLAIPFALDPRWTSAWWAVEAAAVYWLGAVQRQPLARAFALALQVLAGLVFAADTEPVGGRFLLNAHFLGTVLIGIAAYATVLAGDRYRDRIGNNEQSVLGLLFVWGAAWSTLGGIHEMREAFTHPAELDASLAWVVGCGAAALAARHWLRWERIGWLAALVLPAMALAGFEDLRAVKTTLTHYGWVVWPLGWLVHWVGLRALEPWRDAASGEPKQIAREDVLRNAHAVSAVALVAWASWEASEWVGRYTEDGTVWIACAVALPAIVYLAAIVKYRDASAWPLPDFSLAYGASAGTVVAALLEAWFAIVNIVSPGDPYPLPYYPIANPLDLSLIAALAALFLWMRVWGRNDDRTRFGLLGAGAFIALNGTVVRTAHHWGGVAWRWQDLIEYRPLQAALTLTWTITALGLMLWATRRKVRMPWMVGAALLAVVVVKLFAVDLAALYGLTRVVAFLGVGALLLVIGYVAPLPPASEEREGQPAPSDQ